jgi:hypothetical protein
MIRVSSTEALRHRLETIEHNPVGKMTLVPKFAVPVLSLAFEMWCLLA